MIGFLRDPIWQFIGAALALVAVLISVYFFVLQRRKKSLTYDVLALTPLLTVDEEIKGKVQILLEGTAVQNVHLVVLKIRNDGNVPIESSDFASPLVFPIREGVKVLGAEVIDTTPRTLKPELRVDPDKITLSPLLLNSGDTVVFKLLLSHSGGGLGLRPEARIVGVNDIAMREFVYRPFLTLGALVAFLGTVWLILLFPESRSYMKENTPTVEESIAALRFFLPLLLMGVGLGIGQFPIIREDCN